MSEAPKRLWAMCTANQNWDEPLATPFKVDHFEEYAHIDELTALQAENARLRALIPHPDETDLEYILRETNRGVRIEDIAKRRGITRERARLKLAKAREQLGGMTPAEKIRLRDALATHDADT